MRFITDQIGVGRDLRRQDLPHHRRRQLVDAWSATRTRAVHSFFFLDANNGFAVGDGSLFLVTKDGGATWTPQGHRHPADQPALDPVRDADALRHDDRAPARRSCAPTTAATTARLVTPSPGPDLRGGLRLADAHRGDRRDRRDGGLRRRGAELHPDRRAPERDATRGCAPAARPGTAFAPGDNGSLAKTTDGGKTWTRGNVATSEDVLDVAFPTAQDGYALDTAGGLFRTDDGGATWRTLDTGTTARPLRARRADARRRSSSPARSGLRRSTDGGDTFSTVTDRDVVKAKLDAIDRAGSALFASGSRDLLRSTDRGKTWTAAAQADREPQARAALRQVDFLDAEDRLLAGRRAARCAAPPTPARRGPRCRGVGTETAYGMAFSSDDEGLPGHRSLRRRVEPLGLPAAHDRRRRARGTRSSWSPRRSPGDGIAAGPGGTDYLLGGESSLLFTTTGGEAGKASTLTVTTKQQEAQQAGGHHRHRHALAGRGQRAGDGQLPAAAARSRWQHQTVKTAANGSFTTSWRVRKGSNRFVAQWAGDFRSKGDGSGVLTVKVGK